jgi:hypothetical protein
MTQKTMMISMLYSIVIMIMLMAITIAFINYLEGDILPDTSPWSFISFNTEEGKVNEYSERRNQ